MKLMYTLSVQHFWSMKGQVIVLHRSALCIDYNFPLFKAVASVPYEKDHVACFFLPEVHREGTPWNSSLHKIHGFSPSTIFGQK